MRTTNSNRSLLLDEELGGFLVANQGSWRRVVARACEHGVPVLSMAASLSYFDSFRRARLPQNLTQAQRDYFGAHTFERTDKAVRRALPSRLVLRRPSPPRGEERASTLLLDAEDGEAVAQVRAASAQVGSLDLDVGFASGRE